VFVCWFVFSFVGLFVCFVCLFVWRGSEQAARAAATEAILTMRPRAVWLAQLQLSPKAFGGD
jgi:hypothetical protein